MNTPREPFYRIGTVSRLTGIATVTLRMWERRYNVVEPDRSRGRNRLYSREDIARLSLIKRLVDEGNAISTIANLSLEQLQERITMHATPAVTTEPCRIVILGDIPTLGINGHSKMLPGIDVLAVFRDRQRFHAEVGNLQPNVVVIEYPTLHEDNIDEIAQLCSQANAEHAVVVYGFARQENVRRLQDMGVVLLRAPVGPMELRWACLSEKRDLAITQTTAKKQAETTPQRRFSDDTLVRIAATAPALHCECPRHLVDLLLALNAFESYSKECINRSPADAELHTYLYQTTAGSRSALEEALQRVIDAESSAGILRRDGV